MGCFRWARAHKPSPRDAPPAQPHTWHAAGRARDDAHARLLHQPRHHRAVVLAAAAEGQARPQVDGALAARHVRLQGGQGGTQQVAVRWAGGQAGWAGGERVEAGGSDGGQ